MPQQFLDSLDQIVDSSTDRSIVFFHGYGTDGYDFVTIPQRLEVQKTWNWFFPHGPFSSVGFGKAWFPIDIAELERAASAKSQKGLNEMVPVELTTSRDLFLNWMKQKKLDPERMILGGFSQGAMMALEACLYLGKSPLGVVLLSGAMVQESIWKERLPQVSPLRFYQSHGQHDPILALSWAKPLSQLLKSHQWTGQFRVFQGGHEVPQTVLSDISKFIDESDR